MVIEPFPVFLPQMHLHGRDQSHEIKERAVPHRIAHSDVYVLDFLRDGVQHRNQQGLVRKHDSASLILDNRRNQFCLAYRGRDAYHLNLRDFQSFQIHLESLREILDIPGHEEGGLVKRISHHLS